MELSVAFRLVSCKISAWFFDARASNIARKLDSKLWRSSDLSDNLVGFYFLGASL